MIGDSQAESNTLGVHHCRMRQSPRFPSFHFGWKKNWAVQKQTPNLKMYKSSILSRTNFITKCRTKFLQFWGMSSHECQALLSFALQKRSPDLVQVLVPIFSHLKSGRERWTLRSQGSAILMVQTQCDRWGRGDPHRKVMICIDLSFLVFVWLSFLQASKTLRSWLCLTSQCQPGQTRKLAESFRLSVFKCLITAISVSVAIGGVSLKFLPSVFSRIFFSGPLIHLSSGDPFGWFLGPTSLREHQLMLLMCKGVAHPADCPACVEAAWAKDVGQVLREAMISWIAFVIDFDVFESDSAWNNHDMKFLLYDPILAFLIWSHYRRTLSPESRAGPVVSILNQHLEAIDKPVRNSQINECKMMHPWKS